MASVWIMECKSVEIPELGCVIRECNRGEINDQESLQLDGCPVDRMIARIDDLRTELESLLAERQV
jgi:hypothetical protein